MFKLPKIRKPRRYTSVVKKVKANKSRGTKLPYGKLVRQPEPSPYGRV